MKNGGNRKGAGRKPGSPNLLHKELRMIMMAHLGPEKVLQLIQKAFNMAMDGDSSMIKYTLDQMYGKAREQITIDGQMTHKHLRESAKESLKQKLLKLNKSNSILTTEKKLEN